jgi:CBS domain containing-hemolysin-like protein
VIGVLIALTVLQVIIGELVPKSIALQHPTRTALLTAVPMRASLWLLRWFIAVLNGSGVKILRLMGMAPEGSHRHIHSPEELELLIAESRDGGLLEPQEHQRLHQALRLALRSAGRSWCPARLSPGSICSGPRRAFSTRSSPVRTRDFRCMTGRSTG